MLCPERAKLRKVTDAERTKALLDGRVYVPDGAKVCQFHSMDEEFWEAATIQRFNATQIEGMVDLARSCRSSRTAINIPEYTGLSEQQFADLHSHVPTITKNALSMYLMRLRKATTFEHIASEFGIPKTMAFEDVEKARKALEKDFVPKFLGFANLGRDTLLRHTTDSARTLHANNNADILMTIWDGTYIYCFKSTNYEFQKQTFSGQKKRNFLRPMVCVTTNGYIIDIFGPFAATDNDAKCMKLILDKCQEVNLSFSSAHRHSNT